MEYITVAELRDEFGDDVAEMSDAAIARIVDRLTSYLEGQLGHTFGRAIIVSTAPSDDTVEVTASKLRVGTVDFPFADYATLWQLVEAVRTATAYQVQLLPQIPPSTPSSLLSVLASTPCGPGYADRQVLMLSAMWTQIPNRRQIVLFLPLPIVQVEQVVEGSTILDSTMYSWTAGDSWIICPRVSSCCLQFAVTFVPSWWGSPQLLAFAVADAFTDAQGLSPLDSESFGSGYSYRRATSQGGWMGSLGGAAVRPYAVRLRPA